MDNEQGNTQRIPAQRETVLPTPTAWANDPKNRLAIARFEANYERKMSELRRDEDIARANLDHELRLYRINRDLQVLEADLVRQAEGNS